MKKEDFISSLKQLIPKSTEATALKWIDFAAECVEREQYVNDKSTGEMDKDIMKWLDQIYYGLLDIKDVHNEEMANEIYDLGNLSCVYPGEMRDVVYFFENKCSALEIVEKIGNGKLDADSFFVNIDKIERDHNKARLTYDMPKCVQLLMEIEQALHGTFGTFTDWIRIVLEMNHDFAEAHLDVATNICDALEMVKEQYGEETAQALYNASIIVIPSEIKEAGRYLHMGGKFEVLKDLAKYGFFLESSSYTDSNLKHVVDFINGGGSVNAVFSIGDSCKRESMELTRTDIIIGRDMELDCDVGEVITVYIESWFDVDKKFGIHTATDSETWLNVYGKYNVRQDTVYLECQIDKSNGSEIFYYVPTENESALIKTMIQEKCWEVNHCSVEDFVKQENQDFGMGDLT